MACSNITARGINRRRRWGLAFASVCVALLAVLAAVDARAWTRVLVFVPSWIAAFGLFQAREKT